jgi:hypothetical protein
LPDGSSEVDLRPRIRVPAMEINDWTEELCEEAFNALAETSSERSYPDLTPFFASIKLSFEEFDKWRMARGYSNPFWSGPTASTVPPEAFPGQQLGAPTSRTRKGRKPKFRAIIRGAVFDLMEFHGDLSDDDPEWSVQADVERAVAEALGDDAPAVSTIRKYVASSIAEWRESKKATNRRY